MRPRRRVGRRAVVAVVVAGCLGTSAAAAGAATLSVSVQPKSTHHGGNYTVTIRGTVSREQVRHKPFMIAWIQYSSQPCASSAQKELGRAKNNPVFQDYVTATSFHASKGFKASAAAGTRRVCAYLYAHYVGPSSSVKPIARASAKEIVK
jgi:hypothetical protein